MSEKQKKIHQIALNSSLFKGHTDWYFCYLKSEKIAHVLALLSSQALHRTLQEMAYTGAKIPGLFLHFVAGEVTEKALLAELFTLLSKTRLASTTAVLQAENANILLHEIEHLIEKLIHKTPLFVSPEDFAVSPLLEAPASPLLSKTPLFIKDIYKGQTKSQKGQTQSKRHPDRSLQILEFIRSGNKRASIKDISAVVKGYSEKTIQRELMNLIAEGFIKKEGERRWSVYLPL